VDVQIQKYKDDLDIRSSYIYIINVHQMLDLT